MNTVYAVALRNVLLSVLLAGVAAKAQAIVQIATTSSRYEAGGVRYYFVASNWTVNDTEPNPCASGWTDWTSCVVDLALNKRKPEWSQDNTVVNYAVWDIPVRRNKSNSGELLSDLQKKGLFIPLSSSILVPYELVTDNLCIGFSYATRGPNIGGAPTRYGDCTSVAALPLKCDINGNTTIDHKTLSEKEVDGATASTQLNVSCTGRSSVKVTASRTDASGVRLRSDGSLYSKITVNGEDASSGINVKVFDGLNVRLTVRSTLSTVGAVAPGEFYGSTVITVSPP